DEVFLNILQHWLGGEPLAPRQRTPIQRPAIAESSWAHRKRSGVPPEQGDLRRGLHGSVQRDHPRRAGPSHGRVQGAPQPVEEGERRREWRSSILTRRSQRNVDRGTQSGTAPHRRLDPGGVPDVHRRATYGETRLHDVRAGGNNSSELIWVVEIRGAPS